MNKLEGNRAVRGHFDTLMPSRGLHKNSIKALDYNLKVKWFPLIKVIVICPRSEELDTLMPEIYTERAMMQLRQDNPGTALKDFNFVLRYFGHTTIPALTEHVAKLKNHQKWEEAIRGL